MIVKCSSQALSARPGHYIEMTQKDALVFKAIERIAHRPAVRFGQDGLVVTIAQPVCQALTQGCFGQRLRTALIALQAGIEAGQHLEVSESGLPIDDRHR